MSRGSLFTMTALFSRCSDLPRRVKSHSSMMSKVAPAVVRIILLPKTTSGHKDRALAQTQTKKWNKSILGTPKSRDLRPTATCQAITQTMFLIPKVAKNIKMLINRCSMKPVRAPRRAKTIKTSRCSRWTRGMLAHPIIRKRGRCAGGLPSSVTP